jgi:hypothetical protein
MSDSDEYFELPPRETESLGWPLFGTALIVGVAVYFATENAVVGAVLPALVAGQRLFAAGIWILRRDDDRTRARICFAFYLAAAFWAGGAAAFVSVLCFAAITIATGADPTTEEIAATMLTLAAAVVLNTLIGLGATFAAKKHGIRVWVHPRLKTQCDGLSESITPLELRHYGVNHAIFVVATSIMFPVVSMACGALVHLMAEGPNEAPPASAWVALGLTLGGPIGLIPVYAWVSSKIVARTPQECWPMIEAEV